ncbi:putative TFIIH subunit Tfb1/GTF2H1 protein [Helianthus annuus]|nr:putative TFIIH subunit Tfb1/GTF2H1 protein [Helianthus annuus]
MFNVETGDTRTVAEALASSKRVELAKEASDGNSHQDRIDRMIRMAEIEDLQAPRDPPVAPLCIKDPRDYFDSQQVNAMNQLSGLRQMKSRLSASEAYGSLRAHISEIGTAGFSDPIVRPEVAFQVIASFITVIIFIYLFIILFQVVFRCVFGCAFAIEVVMIR